jgi:hypothetical protein
MKDILIVGLCWLIATILAVMVIMLFISPISSLIMDETLKCILSFGVGGLGGFLGILLGIILVGQ